MKKALGAGILASFFFAFTFILNRSMHLGGGSWVWSASLRYLFTLPVLAAILAVRGGLGRTLRAIAADPWLWLVWSTVGFGLFYAPLSYGSQYGEAWLTAATWQVTIVAGVLLTPLFGEKLPLRQLGWSGVIWVGIFLLQMGSAATLGAENLPRVLLLSMGQLACSYAVPYIIYLAFHLTGSSFVEVFALQVLCSISVGYLPLPGAAGAAETVFLRGFAAVFGAGLIAPAMILSRTVSCYLVLITTGIITALLHFRGRKRAPADAARQLDRQDLAA